MIAKLDTMTFAEVAARYQLEVEDVDAALLDDGYHVDPILLASDGTLLDGFHRVSGYCKALAADSELADEDVRVIYVHSDDIAELVEEPGGVQREAIALLHAIVGI